MKRALLMCWPLALLAGCGASPPPLAADRIVLPPWPDEAMPEARAVLHGFDELQDAPWRVGDAVLFGMRLRDGDQDRRWLLQLRVTELKERITHGEASVELTMSRTVSLTINGVEHKRQSELISASCTVREYGVEGEQGTTLLLPKDFLAGGLTDSCRLFRDFAARHAAGGGKPLPPPDQAQIDALSSGIVTVLALFDIVQGNETLTEIMWQVVEKPSVWSVLTNLGVALSIEPRFSETVPAERAPPPLPEGLPTWTAPLTMKCNDSPILYMNLLVGPPTSPFALCGGIVGLHASDPGQRRTFTMQLLGARRGK